MEEFDFDLSKLTQQKKKELTEEDIRQKRYNNLSKVFGQKIIMLKRIAIDKPYMRDSSTVEAQFQTYETMYESAKKGLYSDAENKAIIAANEAIKTALAPFTLLMNNVRSIIEAKIESGADDVEDILSRAEAVELAKDDLTPEKLAALKEEFGL